MKHVHNNVNLYLKNHINEICPLCNPNNIAVSIQHFGENVKSFFSGFVKKRNNNWINYRNSFDSNDKSPNSVNREEINNMFGNVQLFNGIKLNEDDTYIKGLLGIS